MSIETGIKVHFTSNYMYTWVHTYSLHKTLQVLLQVQSFKPVNNTILCIQTTQAKIIENQIIIHIKFMFSWVQAHTNLVDIAIIHCHVHTLAQQLVTHQLQKIALLRDMQKDLHSCQPLSTSNTVIGSKLNFYTTENLSQYKYLRT